LRDGTCEAQTVPVDLHVVASDGLADLDRVLAPFAADALAVVVPRDASVRTEALLTRYALLDGDIVVAAACDPAPGIDTAAHPLVNTPYRYAAPALMGPVGAIRDLRVASLTDLSARYLAGADLELDAGAQLFLVRDGTGTDAVCIDGKVVATATGTRPAVVIGDPVPDESADDLVRLLAYISRRSGKARMIAPEILRVPFWEPEQCATIVRESEAVNAWGSDPEDPVPGMEVSLATISPVLFEHVERHLAERVVPALREFWPEFAWTGVHDAFVIKYAAGSESTSLALHHDVAQLSGSVRLNAGYEGGALEFPRQDWSNADVPIGDLIVWPSLVTHPHRGAPVTRGVKYALTIWIALPG
jgi:hypothetical protein